jgi:hypothetical protein
MGEHDQGEGIAHDGSSTGRLLVGCLALRGPRRVRESRDSTLVQRNTHEACEPWPSGEISGGLKKRKKERKEEIGRRQSLGASRVSKAVKVGSHGLSPAGEMEMEMRRGSSQG